MNDEKKNLLNKFILYFMVFMLVITTVLACYNTYAISKLQSNANPSQNMEPEPETETETLAVDTDNVIDDEFINAIKDEAYNLGQNTLLYSIKNKMESGTSTLQLLRSLYPDHLIYNQTGGFVFKDIDTTLKMNSFNFDNFKITKDENDNPTHIEYYENDALASYNVIDVSKHQGNIDWSKVKKSNVDYAIIRAVTRGYGAEGKLNTDEYFEKNANGATANNIPFGAYVFSEAITKDEALEEADLVLKLIAPYKIKCPVVIDIEDIQNDTGRNEALTPTELTDIVLTFCNRIKEKGYTPMIYCNLKGFIGMLEFERLEEIDKWYAYYGDNLYFPYEVTMWQYSSTSKVDGISGNVDMNICFKKFD